MLHRLYTVEYKERVYKIERGMNSETVSDLLTRAANEIIQLTSGNEELVRIRLICPGSPFKPETCKDLYLYDLVEDCILGIEITTHERVKVTPEVVETVSE